ncbi:MAG: hypothetical protein N3D11_01950 [Candidatus Sumerlaeia bacterium]|nr:hypothetical protein [Candidatus Sumerlaeia bacterium]
MGPSRLVSPSEVPKAGFLYQSSRSTLFLMKCPYCATDNRDDREACYHCGKDISMLRLIVNKARHHYNVALEHAERQRFPEALAELEHCLELDRSFVPAHVVMGTVYAKMEKFDEAERSWQAALALDPHIQKAHEYLNKSNTARQAVPLLRRLRWLVYGAAAVTALFVFLIGWQIRPTKSDEQVRQILAKIEAGDLGGALNTAERLEESAHNRRIRQAARLLQAAVRQRYELVSTEMFVLLLNDKPVEAHQLFQRVTTGREPPEPYNRQFALFDQKAVEKALDMAAIWQRAAEQDLITYDELVRRIEPMNQAFIGQSEVTARLAETLAAGRRAWALRELAKIPESGLSTSQTLAWLARVQEIARHAPECHSDASSVTQQLLEAAIEPLESRMKKAVAAKNASALRAAIADLEQLAAYGTPLGAPELLEQARADLRRLDVDRIKSTLTALTSADIPQLDGVVAAFEGTTGIRVAEDAETSGALAATRRRLAAAVVNWCSDRYARFAKGGMTDEEAQWILDRADFALEYYAGKTWRYTRDCVMYCAAMAATKAGDTAAALKWVDRLEKTHPESSYLPQARRLRPAKTAPETSAEAEM